MKYPRKINGKTLRLVRTWKGMKQRCYNQKAPNYIYYGAKGIIVCDEWHDFDAFADWAYKNGYNDSLTIDRINPKKGYFPENCRWLSRSLNSQRANLGIIRRPETRKKISLWRTGRPREDMAGVKNPKARSIICVETGVVYLTITEAASSIGVTRGSVSRAARKNILSGGYHWKYA
jgi:hypothetical protein